MKNLYRGKMLNPSELEYDDIPSSNGWVYGYLIENRYIVGDVLDWTDEYFNTEWWVRVEENTVGQCIGIRDAKRSATFPNGEMVFCGDIVKCKDLLIKDRSEFIGVVREGNGGFYIDSGAVSDYRWYDYECLIIGNRWDNFDLMEKYELWKGLRENV